MHGCAVDADELDARRLLAGLRGLLKDSSSESDESSCTAGRSAKNTSAPAAPTAAEMREGRQNSAVPLGGSRRNATAENTQMQMRMAVRIIATTRTFCPRSTTSTPMVLVGKALARTSNCSSR